MLILLLLLFVYCLVKNNNYWFLSFRGRHRRIMRTQCWRCGGGWMKVKRVVTQPCRGLFQEPTGWELNKKLVGDKRNWREERQQKRPEPPARVGLSVRIQKQRQGHFTDMFECPLGHSQRRPGGSLQQD